MKKRVMIVSNTLAEGGAERWASFMVCGLDRKRFDVSLALFRDQRTYPCPEDASVHVLDHHRFINAPRTVRRLRQCIQSQAIDVVVSNGNYTAPFVGQAVSGTVTSWIARFSGSFQHCQASIAQRLCFHWLDRHVASAQTLVANSAGLTGDLLGRWPSLVDRVGMIRNGIDIEAQPELCSPSGKVEPQRGKGISAGTSTGLGATLLEKEGEANPRHTPLIVAGGRLSFQKRPDIFVTALNSLRDRGLNFRAVWCGDGPLREQTQSRINDAGLQDRIELLGFRNNFHQWLAMADCFVLCSDHEGSPNVLAEAMTLGVPVVATDCPHGPAELIGKDRGWLVPMDSSSPEALAIAIGECLCNRPESFERAKRAKHWAERELNQASLIEQWSRLILAGDAALFRKDANRGAAVASDTLHEEVV
ncbi:MAG: glycosyltransferase [Planctomycetaceae bacterium]|nr:glycosyltransferase [Planctomycetaceae bacterium]